MGTNIHGLCNISTLPLNLLPVCVKLVTKLSNEWSSHVYIETTSLSLNSQVSLIHYTDPHKTKGFHSILPNSSAVTWLKYCGYSVKTLSNQSINPQFTLKVSLIGVQYC